MRAASDFEDAVLLESDAGVYRGFVSTVDSCSPFREASMSVEVLPDFLWKGWVTCICSPALVQCLT